MVEITLDRELKIEQLC